jgi:hypothetical protein
MRGLSCLAGISIKVLRPHRWHDQMRNSVGSVPSMVLAAMNRLRSLRPCRKWWAQIGLGRGGFWPFLLPDPNLAGL